MLNLDQVRLLENRVEKAVGKIQTLTAENTHLRSQLGTLQARVNELEGLVRAFKDDQGRIEEGILNALDRLSAFEDSVFHQEKTAVTASHTVASAHTAESAYAVAEPEPAFTAVNPAIDTPTEPVSTPESADESIPDANLDINAEWQDAPAAAKASSSDGQMDIF